MILEPVIGIEVHCELKTKTKLFSSSPVNFNAPANYNVQPLDLGMPGTLPLLNKKAVELAILVCNGLNLEIEKELEFDRKNYFYPDLAKGYQITQERKPIGRNGYLTIDLDDCTKKITISRLHLEEDTAKQTHFSDFSLLDFNRAGNPLIEIVSDPVISSAKEAVSYIENLRLILLYLGVSDVKMEEGSLRCDVNISLKKKGSNKLGTRCEIKNLNSISNVEKAINHEIKRQTKLILNNEKIVEETRRYDEEKEVTISLRLKDESVDYKYFYEANLPKIVLNQTFINNILKNKNKLPSELKKEYLQIYNLTNNDVNQLIQNKELNDFFLETIKLINEPKQIVNWLLGDVLAYLNKQNLKINQTNLTSRKLSQLINKQNNNIISSKQAKIILNEFFINEKSVDSIIKEKNLIQLTNKEEIILLIKEVLANNKEVINDYKNGKTNAFGFLVGQVLKLSKGQANPPIVSELLKEELSKDF